MILSILVVSLFIFVIVLFFSADLRANYAQSNSAALFGNWSNLKLLVNDNISMFISLPTDWKIEKESLYDNIADAIIIVPPKKAPSTVTSSKLAIGIEKLESTTTLSDFSKAAKEALFSNLHNFELIDSFPINISDLSAERIIFTHKVNDKMMQVMQTWLIDNNNTFIVTFATTPESFGFYNPILTKIISSIKIEDYKKDDTSEKSLKISGYASFESPFGFELSYPDNWILSEGKNRLSIISNQSDLSDRYLERLDIYYNLSSNNSLISNSSQTKDEKMRTELLNEIKYMINNLQNLDIISIKNVNVSSSNITAKELLYGYDSNIGKTKVNEYLLYGNSRLVILSFSTSSMDFDKMSDTIDTILDSFKFMNN